jgi:hypothetical protein
MEKEEKKKMTEQSSAQIKKTADRKSVIIQNWRFCIMSKQEICHKYKTGGFA